MSDIFYCIETKEIVIILLSSEFSNGELQGFFPLR